MNEYEELAALFDTHRGYLRSVAYRMLGVQADAEDAVQEAWLRLSRAGAADIDNLRAWLTTVTARVCLDMLRSRTARREQPLEILLRARMPMRARLTRSRRCYWLSESELPSTSSWMR